MNPGNNDRESPPEPTESVSNDGKSTRDKRNDDWIAEMEPEMQQIAKKWPGARQ